MFPFKDFLVQGQPLCVILSVGMRLYFAKLLESDTQELGIENTYLAFADIITCVQLPTVVPWKTGHVPEWQSGLCAVSVFSV